MPAATYYATFYCSVDLSDYVCHRSVAKHCQISGRHDSLNKCIIMHHNLRYLPEHYQISLRKFMKCKRDSFILGYSCTAAPRS